MRKHIVAGSLAAEAEVSHESDHDVERPLAGRPGSAARGQKPPLPITFQFGEYATVQDSPLPPVPATKSAT